MNTTLRSSSAEAVIDSLGAELVSFKLLATGTEYIWSGDAKFWTGRSPVLFPIIGAARGGEIRAGGSTYTIGNHGFARRSEFTLVEATDTHAVFKLSQSGQTLASYPYSFNLFLTYILSGSRLEISYRVENTDEQEIHFQLGTHPAFNCPLDGQGAITDYYLEFSEQEQLERLFLNDAGLVISGKSAPVLDNEQLLPLSHELFLDGALVFRNVKSGTIALKSKLTDKSVTVTSKGFPDLGLWQPKNAPFVCIEPWQGIADGEDFSGELKDKTGIITLPQGGQFNSSLTIEIN
ncbi:MULTISPECIES: aldose 1-epimerase family protein [unclassified Paenibacillus]|uniref:aldose 1-epimerase family protein n=1 Tax=unclassified Paenibacillus TaxID=185978 RepID=UPI0024056AB6|nr:MULTISPECIES: aldose 1-epimerase family protein [unclassified Paenibacillus]MDF9840825.1 galactose mutarotase-like enzyme [Paenibacillus sp. PastF-2]MDF9847408.1 galactose mutarotase-like enzyme [Paenibacillus sp. PastM-2]MDF9854014.1 galactose mutarotase-like enzyme [Paenibacillus sp. PastF-1]MDH6479287.1 galactose mutarotase-like enzyme [Paenibacillus sp. PastH-2]MDH6506978.1 galactose mutarotase-like enzyme [Paenibacillus sp. PastM-3]